MIEKKPNIIKTFFKLLPNAYKSAPVLFIVTFVISFFHGISWGVITVFTQDFFDKATAFAEEKSTINSVIVALIVLGLAHIINQIINGVGNFIPGIYAEHTQRKLSIEIHKKMAKLSPVNFEDTALLDDINKAEQGKMNSVWFVLTFFVVFTFYIPYFLFMSAYLYSLKPILAISVVIIFIPLLLTQVIRAKVFAKLEDKSAPIRREYDYHETCIVSREYFKETRLLGGFSFFKNLYIDSLKLMNKLRFNADVKTNLYELAMKVLTLCGYFIILYMLFVALMDGEISVGAFAAVFVSIGNLFGLMEEIVCRHFGQMSQNLGTIQNYINFMEMKEHEGTEIEIQKNADITLSNVTFAYPNVTNTKVTVTNDAKANVTNDAKANVTNEKANVITNAVNNVSFTIKNGETIAIVGENGSGKSTLIRLITGMYSPTSGDVFYNDINTRDVSLKSLFANMSAVFQKHQKYQVSLRENICISKADKVFDDTELDRVCELSGVNKDDTSYTDGYDTMLSREFDGVDLSGGQWQRLAIARAFFRPHNMIILDEPTAAIDPFEETKIYNRFAEISKDKTAIIVTHRLGSVKLADRILVMSKGNLVETGTHESLMKHGGEYARMYASQEQWYKE